MTSGRSWIIDLKRIDLIVQLLTFLVAMAACCFTTWSILSFYLVGIVQSVSCMLWVLMPAAIPRLQSRKAIQIAFLVLLIILITALVVSPGAFLELSVLMLVWGPIAGVGYLLVTWKEVGFYHALYEAT